MSEEFQRVIEEGFKQLKLDLSGDISQSFHIYKNLLMDWNTRVNLTSIQGDENIAVKHFLDSVSLISKLNINKDSYIIDVGTGAGFPGIPIKIVLPETRLVLLDAVRKKIDFLSSLVERINLKNVELIHGRAEDLARNKEYRERFDLVVSRAVAPINILAEYTLPFLRLNGQWVCYKGMDIQKELEIGKNAIELLGGELQETIDICLFDNKLQHRLLIIQKKRLTPTKYPRKPGMAKKMPIY